MHTNSRNKKVTREGSRPVNAEQRLKELGINIPYRPSPLAPTWKRYRQEICFF